MIKLRALLLLLTFSSTGFSAQTEGGKGGTVIRVTRRDDDPQHPAAGSLRWALKQKGARIVKFAVGGEITLKERLIIKEPYLTLDGTDAPENGITIRGGSLMFKNTHDIIVRQVRIRLGEEPARRQRREQGTDRPQHSAGLDCVSLDDTDRVLFDHCSLSWSCDEIFGIVRCRDVTIQWCILSDPLEGRALHPYSSSHACPVNASASTLSIHHCLIANFNMRGPQFECNDVGAADRTSVRMEAVNNIIAGYQHSGSRYSVGVEKDNGTGAGKSFRFQFINNLYLTTSRKPPAIEAITRHGVTDDIRLHASGNILRYVETKRASAFELNPQALSKGAGNHPRQEEIHLEEESIVRPPYWQRQDDHLRLDALLSLRPLFSTPASRNAEPANEAAARVIRDAGCTQHRDAVDQSVLSPLEKQGPMASRRR